MNERDERCRFRVMHIAHASSHTNRAAAAAALFLTSAAASVVVCTSMPLIMGPELCGGTGAAVPVWRAPGQTWLAAATAFVAAWTAMMIAMMVPAFVPELAHTVRASPAPSGPRAALATRIACGYILVWATAGGAVFSLGCAVQHRRDAFGWPTDATAIASGLVLTCAGVLQMSAWKARRLAACRGGSFRSSTTQADATSGVTRGVAHGLACLQSCIGITLALAVSDMTDHRLMVLATAAISAERLLPHGAQVARATGALLGCAGLLKTASILTSG